MPLRIAGDFGILGSVLSLAVALIGTRIVSKLLKGRGKRKGFAAC